MPSMLKGRLMEDSQIDLGREARLQEMAGLKPGWLDGSGEPICPVAIDAARTALIAFQEHPVATPGMFATEEGGLLLEWASKRSVVSLEIAPGAAGTTLVDVDVFSLDVRPDHYTSSKSNGTTLDLGIAWIIDVLTTSEFWQDL